MEEKDKKSLIKTEIYYILYYTYDRTGGVTVKESRGQPTNGAP